MRLLLILTEFPPSVGGMQTHAIHLAKYLHAAGHNVEVLTYRSRRAKPGNSTGRCRSPCIAS